MSQDLSSAAVVIGALRVNFQYAGKFFMIFGCLLIISKKTFYEKFFQDYHQNGLEPDQA